MQAITGALGARASSVAVLLPIATVALVLTCAESAAASPAYRAASARPHPIPWTGWNGRPIQRPGKPIGHALLKRAAFSAGWSAGAVRYGTGYHRLGGSDRVREVQRRLTRLGYHTGPVDGLYGALTRSAVQWFQIKHGLRPTGVVAATTLAALRNPRGFTRQPGARAKRLRVPSRQPGATRTATPQRHPARLARQDAPAWLVAALIAALATALLVALATVRRYASIRSGRREQPARPRVVMATPATSGRDADPVEQVLGYLTGRSSEKHEEAIKEACRIRGWTLARLVHDVETGTAQPLGRPGLTYALEQLTEGAASRLVVHRLDHIARSVAELAAVLGSVTHTGAGLTVLDLGLDTGSPAGQSAARALLSVSDWTAERNGLASGRPAVGDSPELAGRIRGMRASGMTLQAIADTLNREEVPTVRGGAEWRPSSVQAVLGYRRPRTLQG